VLRLSSSWVWDFWLADDGDRYHVFFLKASRALGDPERRHRRAGIGHAVSDDLRSWTEVADALVADDEPAPDDLATWTGSVVRGPDGRWRMFYTGLSRADGGLVQRVLCAVSDDLTTWHRQGVVAVADPRWYNQLDLDTWYDVAWRDPWVFQRTDGVWQMLVTARSGDGAAFDRGVVGAATSTDLVTWEVGPPLSQPGSGFGQLEVLQVAEVEGRGVVLFSCLATQLPEARRTAGETGGIWAVDLDDPGDLAGPYDISRAYLLHDPGLYVGRLVQDRAGAWQLMAFHNEVPGGFGGEITDPMPVSRGPDGRLRIDP
jgi:beta-fructofuranosidase